MSADGAPAALNGAGGGLNDRQLGQLGALLETLAQDEHAPTAVRSAAEAAEAHIADSLVALELAAVREARAIADMGAGAGFPGMALAVALPGAEVSLIESQRRRCEFIEIACQRAGIANARVVCTRLEQWREGLGKHDVVVARALAEQAVVLEYAAPLLRLGGTLVDWRGKRVCEQERASQLAATELGLQRTGVLAVHPFEGARDRHLHLYLKVNATPARFPRRTGVARKRPLGRSRSTGG